jgi:hypothetical protein
MAEEITEMSTLVQIQTLRGTAGIAEALKSVEAAVAKRNTENPKTVAHVVEQVTALPNNVKGMQWQLALLATLARKNDATMIRLSVHNGHVALCGTPKAVETTRNAMLPAYNALVTAVSNAYSPSKHGNRVGFTNGWLCGAPAGMQDAAKLTPELGYGIGFLFEFPAPGTGVAYDLGYAEYAKPSATGEAAKAAKAAKAAANKAAKAAKAEQAAKAAEAAKAEQAAKAAAEQAAKAAAEQAAA